MIAMSETGEGRPLALLHGVGASRVIWRHVTPMLSQDRRVLAPDLPGFGDSDPAGPGFELAAVAHAVGSALADRAGEPFDLVGNSLGGAVALELALTRPEVVSRLVLSAPAGLSPRPWPLPFAAERITGPSVAARRVFGTPLAVSPIVRRAILWGAIAAPQRLSAEDARMMLTASRGSTRIGQAVGAVLRADLLARLDGLEVPVGLIWGRHDRVIPFSAVRSVQAARPDIVVEPLSDAAHVPQVEQPSEFVAALRRVLARLAQG
jgi:pimeloyl-ACP methyl ester carboxylesterase